MSVRHPRIEICDDCACQVRVSPNFRGHRVLCKECRNRDHTHDAYEAECEEYDSHVKSIEDEPWDSIAEDCIDLPPISSIVRPHDWIVKLDIRGSRKLVHYDRSLSTPSSDK